MEMNGFSLGNQRRRDIGERVGKADTTTKSSVAIEHKHYTGPTGFS